MNLHVVVTGGRDFTNRPLLHVTLDSLSPSVIHHGGATGADGMADAWAVQSRQRGHEVLRVRWDAQWGLHGKAAGPIRNANMLAEAKRRATYESAKLLVVAFPGGAGTANCVETARKMGIEVWEVK